MINKVLPAWCLRTAFHELKARLDRHRAMNFVNKRLGLNLELHAKAFRHVDRRSRSQGLREGHFLERRTIWTKWRRTRIPNVGGGRGGLGIGRYEVGDTISGTRLAHDLSMVIISTQRSTRFIGHRRRSSKDSTPLSAAPLYGGLEKVCRE